MLIIGRVLGLSGSRVRCYEAPMSNEQRTEELRDQYRHGGFYPGGKVSIASWDDGARIIRLTRRSKKRYAAGAAWSIEGGTTGAAVLYETLDAAVLGYTLSSTCAA